MGLRNVFVSEQDLVDELAKRAGDMTQAKIARRLRMAAPLISNILSGKSHPCGKVLRWLGYERVVLYKKIA